jgi:hypothetical protein
MADATYQPKVYKKQGGDELVVANGGALTVESGGTVDLESGGGIDIESGSTIGIESGGKIIAESGGEIEGLSGGFFDAQAGFDFYLTSVNNTLSAAQLRVLLWNNTTFSTIQESTGAGSGVLSIINLPSAGMIVFSMSDAASNASAWLTSMNGIPGQRMILMIRGGQSQGSVYISTSGVSLVGTLSGDLSSISLQQSAAVESQGYVELICTDTDEWSILNQRGQVVQRGSS